MKPFLILQLRPNDMAADNEFSAFLLYGGLLEKDVHRVRMEKEGIPEIDLNNYSAIIIGGGPSNVSDPDKKKEEYEKRFEADLDGLLDKVFEEDFPVLGNCYGIGALAKNRGGEVSKENYSENIGAVEVEMTEAGKKDDLLAELPTRFLAYVGHKEACQSLPTGATLLVRSDNCPIQMIRFGKNSYATQFHTELDWEGILVRIDIYKNHGYYSLEDVDNIIEEIKKYQVTAPGMILRNFVEKYKQAEL